MSDKAMCINPDHLEQLRLIASGLPKASATKLTGMMIHLWYQMHTAGISTIDPEEFKKDLTECLGLNGFETTGILIGLTAHEFIMLVDDGRRLRVRLPMILVDGGAE